MVTIATEIIVHILSYMHLYQEQLGALSAVGTQWRKVVRYFWYQKPRTLCIAFAGPHGAGKSCTIARLLCKRGFKKCDNGAAAAVAVAQLLAPTQVPTLVPSSSQVPVPTQVSSPTVSSSQVPSSLAAAVPSVAAALATSAPPTLPPPTPPLIDQKSAADALYSAFGSLLDTHREERERLCTVHPKRIATGVGSRMRSLVLLDTPGHHTQHKNKIRSLSGADVLVLTVPVHPLESEQQKILVRDFQQDIFLALAHGFTLGATQLVVVVTKFDLIQYNQLAFKELERKIRAMLSKFNLKPMAVVPVSVLDDVNLMSEEEESYSYYPPSVNTTSTGFETDEEMLLLLMQQQQQHNKVQQKQHVQQQQQHVQQDSSFNCTSRHQLMPWYNGPSLNQVLNLIDHSTRINNYVDTLNLSVNYDPSKEGKEKELKSIGDMKPWNFLTHFQTLQDMPLRFVVHKVFTGVHYDGIVASGQVIAGVLKEQTVVVIEPSGVETTVCSIQINRRNTEIAYPGDYASIVLKSCSQIDVYRGSIVADANRQAPIHAKEFTARINFISPLNEKEMRVGYQPLVFCHAQYAAVELVSITAILDKAKKDDHAIKKNPTKVRKGETALATFRLISQPLAIESFHEFNKLGRFILKDSCNTVVAVGVVRSIEPVRKMRKKPHKTSPVIPKLVNKTSHTPAKSMENVKMNALREEMAKIWSSVTFKNEAWQKK